MAMRKIDAKLFVMCRLCLKDTGTYQILPQVQHKIKFCFDIDVNLYDGLPQLICNECSTFLEEVFAKKNIFTDNQVALKSKLEVGNEIDINKDNTTQTANGFCEKSDDDEADVSPNNLNFSKKRRARLISSSSSSEDVINKAPSPVPVSKITLNKTCPTTPPITWQSNYKKRFVCRLCHKFCKKRRNLVKHFRKHDNFVTQHRNVFNRSCKVVLAKIDGKPNLTGLSNTIVFSRVKIMADVGKTSYYVIYSSKEHADNNFNSSDESKKNKTLETKDLVSDSSEDNDLFKRLPKKRQRLHTRSSNDTVVLEGDIDKNGSSSDNGETNTINNICTEPNITECINIDDSSDSASCKSSNMDLRSDALTTKTIKASSGDFKALQNIISVCHNKYLKKKELCENTKNSANSESQLKHKILSMGRKIISKQGINCTGLLRFMEHKNLEIKWLHKMTNVNKETQYVHIMPKLREKETCTDNPGWKNIWETETNKFVAENMEVTVPVCASESNGNFKENQPLVIDKETTPYSDILNIDSDKNLKNKLLNANPVANPKQLPKKLPIVDKINTGESNISILSQVQNSESNICVEEKVISENSLCMPIITSTTSLAALTSDVLKDNDESNKTDLIVETNTIVTKGIGNPVPRIKVKPASELMSERILKNLTQPQAVPIINVWNLTANVSDSVANSTCVTTSASIFPLPVHTDVPSSSNVPMASEVVPKEPTTNREYVVLNTVELPNTKTYSPFQYLTKLLQIHNIILLDSDKTVTRDFVCLIKFKVQYLQETAKNPIVLHLSFQCALNKFFIGVKHSAEGDYMDFNTLSANWQWEILNNLFRDQVHNKLLKNAERIGSSVYEHTKNFLCLLKSVELKKGNEA